MTMCFEITDPKMYTADKDIICYKTLGMPYKLGHLYELGKELEITQHPEYRIQLEGTFRSKIGIIEEGFISEIKFPIFGRPVECIIPKGAHYYKNTHEYISDKILIHKRIFNHIIFNKMEQFTEYLKVADEYNLLAEVIAEALETMQRNPKLTNLEALKVGFEEWVK
jgi:hypothetical protein